MSEHKLKCHICGEERGVHYVDPDSFYGICITCNGLKQWDAGYNQALRDVTHFINSRANNV